MAASPLLSAKPNVAIIRRMSMETYMVRIYLGALNQELEFVSVEAEKVSRADEVVRVATTKLRVSDPQEYELAEVLTSSGKLCKERRLEESENPVRIQLVWPRIVNSELDKSHGLHTGYRFYLRKKDPVDPGRTRVWRDYQDLNRVDNFLERFLRQSTSTKVYTDLCNLPDLNELTLLENIECRFKNSNIYTYVGSILIAVNPFKFFPIYNPKYVKMYQNKRLGDLPPHIFAIADAAFHTMLRTKKNQCIVISGESGSGKTESTNLLLHHLTALSHKGLHGSGVEQTILGAGPVLEAFGNAKTVHNNNSSRFGKFIQVNYKENGMVHGAIVEKYLLEKSRIVSQAYKERNYHVFYYLLKGAEDLEREKLHLGQPEDYFYLRQSSCFHLEEIDEAHEFRRLKQSMELVGFSQVTQKRIFGVLSAVLHLGNVEFKKRADQHHDESVSIQNMETLRIISNLLKVKEKVLLEALTQKRATAGDETVLMTHRMEDAVATRDAMAKCLYGALFDWIVLKVNQALLAKRHNSEHQGNSIGVLDIFGFEDFSKNSFEQFCINYANEHLQYYFNQHIFKFEQEEYKKEGIQWKNIEFIDNTVCLELFSKKTVGLFSLLDEECNFPGATNETLLTKFHHHYAKGNVYYDAPQKKEGAFAILHYAGKVKYFVKDFREKNSDQIRTDIVGNLKSSSLAFVRELMGVDPVAVLRWTILKTLVRSVFAFMQAGKRYRERGGPDPAMLQKRHHVAATSPDYLPLPDLGSSHFLSFYTCAKTVRLIKKIHKGHPPDKSRSPLHENRYSRHAMADLLSIDEAEDDVFTASSPRSSTHSHSPVYKSADECMVMRRASQVMMKNKSFKPKTRPNTMFSDIKTLKAIANRTMYSGGKVNTNKRPPSVSAQFQWSLSRLMQTLNQANPFFIRCIKSNAEKQPCQFDNVLVLQQLRYTGMLATVRIRQSGYNYRLLFEEFIQLYQILLPRGLASDQSDISTFLQSMDMNHDNYQIGKTKVFLRETEKLFLDDCLHRAIMKRIVFIQRWVKTKVERKTFIQMRTHVIIVQKCVRSFLVRRRIERMMDAVMLIQRWFRGVRVHRTYHLYRRCAIRIQANIKGHLQRKRYQKDKAEYEQRLREAQEATKEDLHSCTSDEGVLVKDGSADELEMQSYLRRDSMESSGVHDESETETASESRSHGGSLSSPPPTPTMVGPEITIESLPGQKDTYLSHAKQHSSDSDRSTDERVADMKKFFSDQQEKPGYDDVTDGRSVPYTIFIPRGSARRPAPQVSPAPLAKPESFSDLTDGLMFSDSPTADKSPVVSPLSPDRIRQLDEHLKKPAPPVEDSSSKSPLRLFRNLVVSQESLRETKSYPSGYDTSSLRRRMSFSTSILRRTRSSLKLLREKSGSGGGRRSNEEVLSDHETTPHMKAERMGGVSVFPVKAPHSPRNQRGDLPSQGSFDEDKDRERRGPDRNRRQTRRHQEKEKEIESQKGWSVAKMSQWQYPEEFIIQEVYELQLLDEFINRKIQGLRNNTGKGESQFEVIFTKCLKSFQSELKVTISVQMQKDKEGQCNMKYRDLFVTFEEIMNATCNEEKVDESFPSTMLLNAFRGFLDEFRNTVNSKKKEKKEKHVKKKPNRNNKREKMKKDVIEFQGHKFSQMQFGMPTFCEFCSDLLWIMEKGHVCQNCKYTCHRKCINKTNTPCKGTQDSTQQISGTKVYGVPLKNLVGKDEKVPQFMDNLISLIETHGLFTVGIYRKPGSNHKVKMLKLALDSGLTDINIEEYPVHVLTNTLKAFFRDLPEPLLTFELYDEFIQAAEIHDEKEAVQVLYTLIERVPHVNHNVLERLIFHLARVASKESTNKMSVHGLSIIFAPCLLRTDQETQAQDMLIQMDRQQRVVEKILQEHLRKMLATLRDISTLESAEITASERLNVVRASMRNISPVSPTAPKRSESDEDLVEQERVISSHIRSLKEERDNLTSAMPQLEYRHSSDDEMLSIDDVESTYDTADDMEYSHDEQTPPTFHLQAGHSGEPVHVTRPTTTPPTKPSTTTAQSAVAPGNQNPSSQGHQLTEHQSEESHHPGHHDNPSPENDNQAVAIETTNPSHGENKHEDEKSLKQKDLDSEPCGHTAHGLTIPIALHKHPDHSLHPDNRDKYFLKPKGHTPGSSPGLKTKHPRSKQSGDVKSHSRGHLSRAKVLTRYSTVGDKRHPLIRQCSDPTLRSSESDIVLGTSPMSDSGIMDMPVSQHGDTSRRQRMEAKRGNRHSTYETGRLALFDEDSNTDEEIMV